MNRSVFQKRRGFSINIQTKKPARKRLALLSCAAIAASAMTVATAHAQTAWTNGSTDGLWFNAANWTNGVPVAGETVTFNDPSQNGVATTINTGGGNPTASQLNFTNTASTTILTGSTGSQNFNMDNGGIFMDAAAGAVNFGNNLTSGSNLNFNLVGNVLWQNNSANTLSIKAGPGANSVGATPSGNATLTIDGVGNTFIGGSLANNGAVLSVVKNGAGFLEIDGNNSSFTGGLTINAGIVTVKSGNSLNTSATTNLVTINGGTLAAVSSQRTIPSSVKFLVGGDFTLGTATSVNGLNGNAFIFNGSFDLGGTTRTITTAANTQNFYGGITNGGIDKKGPSTLTIGGVGATYSGPTIVDGGILQSGTVTASNAFSPNSALTVNGGTVALAGFQQTVGSLAGTGSVTLGNVTAGVIVAGGDNTSTTFGGTISGNGTNGGASDFLPIHNIGLEKIGSGAMALTGTGLSSPNLGVAVGTSTNFAGTLSFTADTQLGGAANAAYVYNGSLLANSSVTTARPIILNDANGTLDASSGNTFILTGSVTDVGAVNKGTNAGTVQFAQATGYTATANVNVLGGTLAFGDTVNGVTGPVNIPGTLNVSNGALASFIPATGTAITHTINTLNLNSSGKLDVGNSSFLTNSNVQPYLAAGYNNGAWNGSGAAIISTSANTAPGTAARSLGFANDADQGAGRVSANIPTLAAGQTLVKYTTPGDADLSGKSDFNDFLAMQNNFNKAGNWTQGDFDYNGTTNFNDFLILQNNFNRSLNANGTVANGTVAGGAHAAVSKLTASPAAVTPSVTYILSKNDDGKGNLTPGKYAVYAVDSSADGNQGVASFSVDVQGASLVTNFAPQGTFDKGQGNGSTVVEGFTLLRSVSGAFSTGTDPVKGSQDTVDDQSGVVLIYGMGQVAGNLNTKAPSGSTGGSGKVQASYGSPLLISTGTFASGLAFNSDQTFDKANVFLTNTAADTEAAGITLVTQDLSVGVPEPTALSLVALGAGSLLGRRKRRK